MTGVPLVFADLVLILVLARLCGAAALRLGQPPVIGEIVAGLLLGPTLFHGAVAETLVPAAARPTLSALANVGVALFMFAVGFELDHAHLRRATGSAIGLSVVSTLLPLGLGAGLGVVLIAGQHPRSPLGFVLFLGAAMAVTAFPVLARILTDRRLQHTALGRLRTGDRVDERRTRLGVAHGRGRHRAAAWGPVRGGCSWSSRSSRPWSRSGRCCGGRCGASGASGRGGCPRTG